MAYFKKRIREWIKSIHTFEAKKDCYLRLLREQIEKDNDKAKDEKLNPVRLIDIGILSPESNSPFDFFTPYVLVEINGRRFKHQTAELSCAIMVDSLAGYLEECILCLLMAYQLHTPGIFLHSIYIFVPALH